MVFFLQSRVYCMLEPCKGTFYILFKCCSKSIQCSPLLTTQLYYGMQVYEEVAVKAYDVLDLKRQHKNFLKNLNLIHVPVMGETG